MAAVVLFDSDVHMEDYRRMNIDYGNWMADQYKENYNLDLFSMIGN
jgi:hypothetical protein